ncbi:ISAs1 family transposase [Desulfococcaceae bacterium HSG9]|nr:ISAs1 family transposase [Desulfococcaceae bacterium HSG9]
MVTIDAMGCRKAVAEKITNKEADYVPALKGCQGDLSEDVELFFDDAGVDGFKNISADCYETTDGDHGRIEIRRRHTVSDIDWLSGKENRKGLNIMGMAESERHIGDEVGFNTGMMRSDSGWLSVSVRELKTVSVRFQMSDFVRMKTGSGKVIPLSVFQYYVILQ